MTTHREHPVETGHNTAPHFRCQGINIDQNEVLDSEETGKGKVLPELRGRDRGRPPILKKKKSSYDLRDIFQTQEAASSSASSSPVTSNVSSPVVPSTDANKIISPNEIFTAPSQQQQTTTPCVHHVPVRKVMHIWLPSSAGPVLAVIGPEMSSRRTPLPSCCHFFRDRQPSPAILTTSHPDDAVDENESAVDDFTVLLLRALGYAKRGRVPRTRKIIPFVICAENSRLAKTHLVAEATAAFAANDQTRHQTLGQSPFDSKVMAGITMRGTAPTFYKIEVTTALVTAVAGGVYPIDYRLCAHT
ncbi:hypothetical protein EV702DRAFT_1271524 [Suillus placidus]|uniref:Uncharacterized protein n=1 Tax=Suillus placidus TaxID=48579 RepID=A0A9P6ZJK9_9AGAM|nr:hypothetical protein EV702DRAFT_1271524 [Suillus placidus]